MKYLIIPIIKLLLWLSVCIMYIFIQISYICWHLTAYSNSKLLNRLIGNQYWYRSPKDNIVFKKYVVPKSLFTFLIWLYKYGFDGEITELTEKEYKQYQMNKTCV